MNTHTDRLLRCNLRSISSYILAIKQTLLAFSIPSFTFKGVLNLISQRCINSIIHYISKHGNGRRRLRVTSAVIRRRQSIDGLYVAHRCRSRFRNANFASLQTGCKYLRMNYEAGYDYVILSYFS